MCAPCQTAFIEEQVSRAVCMSIWAGRAGMASNEDSGVHADLKQVWWGFSSQPL